MVTKKLSPRGATARRTPRIKAATPVNGSGHAPLDRTQLEAVARLFDTLSEPTRLAILQHLQSGPASVGEVVQALGMKQANASKQLSVLQHAGIVARRQDGLRAIYSIAMPLVFELCALVCSRLAEQARDEADRWSA